MKLTKTHLVQMINEEMSRQQRQQWKAKREELNQLRMHNITQMDNAARAANNPKNAREVREKAGNDYDKYKAEVLNLEATLKAHDKEAAGQEMRAV